jgi:hypothetical protein
LEYIISGNRIKENIIIKEKSDSYVYEFDMKLNKLTAEIASDGTIVLKDEKSGESVFVIDLPYMYDANGEISDAVTYSLEKIKNKEYRITVTADSAWMNDESRAFPVTIDPPIEIQGESSTQDTYADEANPNSNYGSLDYISVGYNQNKSKYYRIVLCKKPQGFNRRYITVDPIVIKWAVRIHPGGNSAVIPLDQRDSIPKRPRFRQIKGIFFQIIHH